MFLLYIYANVEAKEPNGSTKSGGEMLMSHTSVTLDEYFLIDNTEKGAEWFHEIGTFF